MLFSCVLLAAAVRLRQAPAALLQEAECPSVVVDEDHSSVRVPNPTFISKLYESKGPCNDSSVAAQSPFHFRAIIRQDEEWIGALPLPQQSGITHLCAVDEGCVGNYEGVPREPEDAGAWWVPIKMAWPLTVLHHGMVIFGVVAVVYTIILAVTAVHAFNWFPADRVVDPPCVLPPSFELLGDILASLGKMLIATASLWIILFVFVVRRSLTPFFVIALLGFPLVLLIVHTVVVMWNMQRKQLYYALFAQGIHLNFAKRWLLVTWWPVVVILLGAFLGCVGTALWAETMAETVQQRVVILLAKLVSVLTPLGYSIFLLWGDDQFIWKLYPLHELMARTEEGHKLGETTQFIHKLAPVDEDTFLAVGSKLFAEAGSSDLILPDTIVAYEDADKVEPLSRWATLKTLRWTIPISFSHDTKEFGTMVQFSGKLRFRLVLVLACVAGMAVVLMLCFMLSYYLHLYPTLARVTVTNGHLEPNFDAHVFEYTILVDKHVKGETLEIVPDSDVTSSYRLYDNRALSIENKMEEPGGVGSVYVPYLRHDSATEQESSADDILRAQEHPVTFYIDALGAGTKQTYTFTAVKTHTLVTDLTYSYTASGENVTVVKEMQQTSLIASAEESSADILEGDLEDVDIYVPPTTEDVSISLSKELILYGPKQRTIDPDEFDWLEAGAKLHLCPPGNDACVAESGGMEKMALSSLEAGVVAVPVVLSAKGGETSTFTVNLVRVQNRLTDVRAHAFFPGKEGWTPIVMSPPFDPLHLFYQAFFEPPAAGVGDMFLKLIPAGDPGVNRVELKLEGPEGLSLIPFCRHPEEFMIAERDEELDCNADPKALEIRYAEDEYKGHVLVRVENANKKAQAFEIQMRVIAEGEHDEERTYTFRFLPQEPMRMMIVLPSGVPAVLEPPFSSEVLNYTALIQPEDTAVTVEMAPTSSFWASTDPEELDAGSGGRLRNGLQQDVSLLPPCKQELERPTDFPGELPGDGVDRSLAEQLAEESNETLQEVRAAADVTKLCPVEVMAFERKPDFPRVFHVEFLPAVPGTITFLGTEDGERMAPLPEFVPTTRGFQTVVPIEGTARLLVAPAENVTATWNGRPLTVGRRGVAALQLPKGKKGLAAIELGPVRAEVCACQRLTGCGEKLKAPDVTDSTNACTLEVTVQGGAPYTLTVREGATALRLEAIVEA